MTFSDANVLQPTNSLIIIRGSSKTYELTVADSDGSELDLSGAVVHFTVKRRATDERALIQKSSADITQIALTDPIHGIAQIYLVPTDTKHLDPFDYVFDVWVVLASGKQYPVVEPSVFTVVAGVTIIGSS